MDNLLHKYKNIDYDWFIIIEIFGKLGTSVKSKNKENIEKYMIQLMCILFKISYIHDINMNHAWKNWNTKAIAKTPIPIMISPSSPPVFFT